MKNDYISPQIDFFRIEYSPNILESISAYGDVSNITDGGDLGRTDTTNDFFNF